MINFNRGSGDRPPDPQEVRNTGNAGKTGLRPAVYESPSAQPGQVRALPPDPGSLRDPGTVAPRVDPPPAERHAPADRHVATTAAAPLAAPSPVSKLFVGVNIKLKGVEISDCDLLVIEGHVEATVHSKEMQVSQPGTLNGTALVDIAEVHGEFTGELTARTRLVVHGTGKVSGTIRYGKLIVEEGGTISGDMKQNDAKQNDAKQNDVKQPDATETRTPPSRAPAHDSRHSNSSSRGAGTT